MDALRGCGAVTSPDRTASFVDFTITLRDPIAPTADFTAPRTEGMVPLTVTFTATSTGDYATEQWDVDGNGSFETSDPESPVTCTYNVAGTHSPWLKVIGYGTEPETIKTSVFSVSGAGGEGETPPIFGCSTAPTQGENANGWGDAFLLVFVLLAVVLKPLKRWGCEVGSG